MGIDAQTDDVTKSQVRDMPSSLSACGPSTPYDYVARNAKLTGVQTVTRVRSIASSDNGAFSIYVAGTNGVPDSGDVAAVQTAINTYAAPLGFTPTVVAANPVTVNVTYALWAYASAGQTSAQITAAVQTALEAFFSSRPIGGDEGFLFASTITACIGSAAAGAFRVTLAAPARGTPRSLLKFG